MRREKDREIIREMLINEDPQWTAVAAGLADDEFQMFPELSGLGECVL